MLIDSRQGKKAKVLPEIFIKQRTLSTDCSTEEKSGEVGCDEWRSVELLKSEVCR